MTDAPERFREVEPLKYIAKTLDIHGAGFPTGISVGGIYLEVPKARALRDWLTKALPEEKP